ncbi:succinate dehydrogenase cytochrome b subunit [uncultured Propionibacterium sp.]|uniref:succinate dehydrogenase cytochrome b subunit n=1 Tax=uncultured Propionibacterium sp. TaxID=218066 RepID=UPI00292FE513|nr:succinate dehydrogenase cytochrome b subunit [uncultured Propionibacterium sp.]
MSVTEKARGQGDTVVRQKLGQQPSNVTLKLIMAVTGTIFVLFVFVHMVGNLKLFLGAEDYNAYAAFLRTFLFPFLPYEGLLMIMRLALGVGLVLHIWAGTLIYIRGRRARGRFGRRGMKKRAWFAKYMIVEGVLLFAFIVVHLLDLTIGRGVATSQFQEATHEMVGNEMVVHAHAYENLVASFSRPWMAILYTTLMLVVALHIGQGGWNAVNDFGGTGPRLRRIWFLAFLLIAFIIMVCNGALPMLVLSGVIS